MKCSSVPKLLGLLNDEIIFTLSIRYPSYIFLSMSGDAYSQERNTEKSVHGIINDVELLSDTDFLVCTFSSNVSYFIFYYCLLIYQQPVTCSGPCYVMTKKYQQISLQQYSFICHCRNIFSENSKLPGVLFTLFLKKCSGCRSSLIQDNLKYSQYALQINLKELIRVIRFSDRQWHLKGQQRKIVGQLKLNNFHSLIIVGILVGQKAYSNKQSAFGLVLGISTQRGILARKLNYHKPP